MGVADEMWSRAKTAWAWRPRQAAGWTVRSILPAAAVASIVGLAAAAAPAWGLRDAHTVSHNETAPFVAAERWAMHNLPHNSVLVAEDSFWVDFVHAGWEPRHVFSPAELDSDPAVKRRLPQGWRSVDYVIVTSTNSSTPTGQALLTHSHVMTSFGRGNDAVEIRAVEKSSSLTGRVRLFQ
jgi:hypothetical protein